MATAKAKAKVGKWAVCMAGKIGRIEYATTDPVNGNLYSGTSLHGEAWQSSSPRVLCEKDQDCLNATFRRKGLKIVK